MATTFASPQTQQAALAPRALSIEFNEVSRTFLTKKEHHIVLSDISFKVDAGQIVAILGSSGCGKSTLLRLVSGLDAPSGGTVRTGEGKVHGINESCAVVFQQPRLLPWRSVVENVALGLVPGGDVESGQQLISELLDLTDLSRAARLYPNDIALHTAQRVSLARALARRPGVLLLDDPFGVLDAPERLAMQDLLLSIHSSFPSTIVMATDSVDEALRVADRVIVIGADSQTPGATVIEDLTLVGQDPRDRSSEKIDAFRTRLLGLFENESAAF